MITQDAPLVSVLVPCRNHAPFVRERLESIAAQTMPRFEVIFLDDGSTDQSYETARACLDDPRFRFLRNPAPTGNPFAAWRLALEQARAPFIWIAESDDACEPDFLALLLQRFACHDGLGLAYCQSIEVDAANCRWENLRHHTEMVDPYRWQADYVADGRQECREALFFRNTIPNASACLFRADALRPALAATTGFSLCGDWAAYAALLLAGWRLAFAAAPRNRYRRHQGTQRQAMLIRGVEVLEGLRVKQIIKAAVAPSAAALSQSAALSLDLLTHLASRTDPLTASAWFDDGALLAALVDFDPLLWPTLAGAAANRWFWLDAMTDQGPYLPPVRVTCNFAPNVPATVWARLPDGPLRLAVSRSPGLFFIERLALIDPASGRERAVYDNADLGRLGLAGQCLTLCRKGGLLLYAYGNDAVLTLPPQGGETVVSLRLTGHSLAAATTWPAAAARLAEVTELPGLSLSDSCRVP